MLHHRGSKYKQTEVYLLCVFRNILMLLHAPLADAAKIFVILATEQLL